jgi:hypothetical protein
MVVAMDYLNMVLPLQEILTNLKVRKPGERAFHFTERKAYNATFLDQIA